MSCLFVFCDCENAPGFCLVLMFDVKYKTNKGSVQVLHQQVLLKPRHPTVELPSIFYINLSKKC